MALKLASHFLARSTSKYFRTNYSTEYKTYIIHYVASDAQSPLFKRMRQEYARRKREGLWWHTTTGIELSKSSVVRSWCRRRLHNAFTEVLKQRGFDEYGRLVSADALKEKHRDLVELLNRKGGVESFALTGSFRFHALVPCLIAKYVHLREDFATLIDHMLEAACVEFNSPPYRRTSPENTDARGNVGTKWNSNRNSHLQTPISVQRGSKVTEYTPKRTPSKHAVPRERGKAPKGTKKTSPASTQTSRQKSRPNQLEKVSRASAQASGMI